MDSTKLKTQRFGLSMSLLNTVARNAFFATLNKLKHGYMKIIDEQGCYEFGDASSDLCATIQFSSTFSYADLVLGGSIALGEAYIRREWYSPDIVAVVRVFARNMDVVESMDGGIRTLGLPVLRFLHWLNRNTRSGSRSNISAHYDLGNDFFQLFLDETMMYSSAIFADKSSTLYEAQLYKLSTICEKLELSSDDHLVEIGTGWGGLAVYAAEHYGCKVTTTTISQEQYSLAVDRVNRAGLEDLVEVLFQDYRDLTGVYDKAVSVEMIEAVGHEFLPEYIGQCSRLLKDNGLFLLQLITIPDQRYDRARKDIDFIKHYIFPGSCIPSVERVMHCIRDRSDLRLFDFADFTKDYAETIKRWHMALDEHCDEIIQMTDESFIRMWKVYFAYCEGGFREHAIGCAHMLFAKPRYSPELS